MSRGMIERAPVQVSKVQAKVVAAQNHHRRSPLHSFTHLNVLQLRRTKATLRCCWSLIILQSSQASLLIGGTGLICVLALPWLEFL